MSNIYTVLSKEFFDGDDNQEFVSKLSDIPYETEEQRNQVLTKLNKLNFFLQSGSFEVDINDFLLVDSCIKYVEMNYSLSAPIIESLNKIYLKYHD